MWKSALLFPICYLLINWIAICVAEVAELTDKNKTCCMLGHIAGDKGYHCHVVFYDWDILERNSNRAHNKKLAFYGRDRVPHFGEKLMIRFEKCLAKNAFIFHKCCYLSAMDKQIQFNSRSYPYKQYLLNPLKNKT